MLISITKTTIKTLNEYMAKEFQPLMEKFYNVTMAAEVP